MTSALLTGFYAKWTHLDSGCRSKDGHKQYAFALCGQRIHHSFSESMLPDSINYHIQGGYVCPKCVAAWQGEGQVKP